MEHDVNKSNAAPVKTDDKGKYIFVTKVRFEIYMIIIDSYQ